jgi:CheY-like chemotaxis protein
MVDQISSRILVVDDWCDTADSLAELLTLWGYDARACYDGKTALELAPAYQPNVVVLDVGMPGMNGFQVALRLRQMHDLETTIIGVSGYTGKACQASARDAGFHQCLAKPVEMKSFRELVRRIAPLPLQVGRPMRGRLTTDGARTQRHLVAS